MVYVNNICEQFLYVYKNIHVKMVIRICIEDVYMYIYIRNIVNKYNKCVNMYGK